MFVFDLTKAGFDALDSLTPNDYLFSSRFNTFKILAEGELLAQTINSDPKTISFSHGQGQIPTFFAFAQFPDGKVAMPDCDDFTAQANVSLGYGNFTIEADASNLNFIFTKPSSNYNVDIKFYIFEVPL